jgi:hypothetical protein
MSKRTDANPDYGKKIESNSWEMDFDKLVAVIKEQTKPDTDWSWVRSRGWRCKYIEIRIDMRDGGFVICDKDGVRISLEELQYQYKRDEDDET